MKEAENSVEGWHSERDLITVAAIPFDFDFELHDDFLQTAVPAKEPLPMSVAESRTPAASPAVRKPRSWSRVAMLWLAAWLAVGGWFLTKSNLVKSKNRNDEIVL